MGEPELRCWLRVSSTEHEHVHGAPAGHHPHAPHGGRHDEHAHHGHGEHPSQPSGGGHEHHHAQEFRRRFWISLTLAVPVVAFSPMIREWLGLPDVTGVQEAVAPVFGTIVCLPPRRARSRGRFGSPRTAFPAARTYSSRSAKAAPTAAHAPHDGCWRLMK
jgi:hypothetical protein